MNSDNEIAALQGKVTELEGKLSEAVNQLTTKIGSAEARAAAAQQEAQQASNWQQTLRGAQGITVRGNVIEGPPTNAGSGGGGGTGVLGTINGVVLVVNAQLYKDSVLNGVQGTFVP